MNNAVLDKNHFCIVPHSAGCVNGDAIILNTIDLIELVDFDRGLFNKFVHVQRQHCDPSQLAIGQYVLLDRGMVIEGIDAD
ncbi:MAG: hypothetical protein M3176_17250 [Chloroflexota bacterium]|nr:hypothetical protein [Chloroflexota bacterium]